MATIAGSNGKTVENGKEFLTRDIDFYSFTGYTGVHTNPGNADSVFHKLVRAIASEANIVVLGTPLANDLVVGLEGGYAGKGAVAAAAQLEAVADAGTGINGAVAAVTIQGDTWA